MADPFSHDLPSSKPFAPERILWSVLSSHKRLPTSDGTANYELRLTLFIHLGSPDLPLLLPHKFQCQLLVPSLVTFVDSGQVIQVEK